MQLRARCRVLSPFAALLALVLAFQPQSASAGITWCRADPGVALNGAVVAIWVAIPDDQLYLVNGPIDVTIKTPKSVDRELLWTDAGFNGYGETVEFANQRGILAPDGSFTVTISVRVPASGRQDIPMRIEVVTEDGKVANYQGLNGGMSVKTKIWGAY